MTIDNLHLTTHQNKLGAGQAIDRLKSRFSQLSTVNCQLFPSGQSMIEVLIAVGVTAALAVSLITTTLITQKAARTARNNSQATKLGQEYIEQVRILRDRRGFDYISGKVDGNCLRLTITDSNPDNWSLDVCTDGEVKVLDKTSFTRKVDIENTSDPNKKLITTVVTWQEGGETKIVSSKTFLSSWCAGAIVPPNPCLFP